MWSKALFSCLLAICGFYSLGQNSYTVSGFVHDSVTKEPIYMATFYCQEGDIQGFTNENGFFTFKSNTKDSVLNLFLSNYDYKPKHLVVHLKADTLISMVLSSNNTVLDNVVIRTNKQQQELGTIQIPIKQLKNIPTLGGEADIIKAYQLLPGVSGGQEGTSGLYVRGGSPDQNLFLLDNIPLYYVNHIGGFVSTFDPNMIGSITLYKGNFPSRYNGRLSSIIDIRMKDGNVKKLSGEVSVGLISTRLQLEGSLSKKDNSWTFLASARRLNLDLLSVPFTYLVSDRSARIGYNFHDLSFKVVKRFRDNSKLFLSLYDGRDKVFIHLIDKGQTKKDSYRFKDDVVWGNRLASLGYSKVFKNTIFANFTLGTTNFRYKSDIKAQSPGENNTVQKNRLLFQSKVNDIVFKSDFKFNFTNDLKVLAGFNSAFHIFTPGSIINKFDSDPEMDTLIKNKVFALENNLFAEFQYRFLKRFHGNIGFNASSFTLKDTSFFAIDPRISLTVDILPTFTFQAGYTRMKQYLHYLSYSGAGLPSDLWIPVTKNLIPEVADQLNAGFTYAFDNSKFPFQVSVEGFYKQMNNLIDYREGASLVDVNSIESKVGKGGKGLIYGVEFLVQKTVGNTTGWVAYTWSKNTRQFADINNGNPYPFRYDRRHELSVVVSHTFDNKKKPEKKIQLTGTWIFSTGNAMTLAQGNYYQMTSSNPYSLHIAEEYAGKNGYRLPVYHRLDLSVNFIKEKKKGTRTWSFSVYNAYNRMNPFMVYYDAVYDNNVFQKIALHQMTIFPLIPSFNYSFKF